MSLRQVILELGHLQIDAWPVPGEMIAQLMAALHHGPQQLLLPGNSAGNQEKGGVGIMTPELGQDERCRCGIRTIVESQSYQGLFRSKPVGAARVPLGHLVYEPVGCSPEQSDRAGECRPGESGEPAR
jgi:hypothetical protein